MKRTPFQGAPPADTIAAQNADTSRAAPYRNNRIDSGASMDDAS